MCVGITGNIQGVNQLSQLVALQAAQQQRAAAGGGTSPRLQSPRPIYPAGLSPMVPNQQQFQNSLSAAVLSASISRALSPQPHLSQPTVSLAKQGTNIRTTTAFSLMPIIL